METSPLTHLNDEDRLFRDSVRRYAREQIAPHVRGMDDAAVIDKHMLRQFFEFGLMGIEIPNQYGGGGGKFFEAILAVEELSRADASAGVIGKRILNSEPRLSPSVAVRSHQRSPPILRAIPLATYRPSPRPLLWLSLCAW